MKAHVRFMASWVVVCVAALTAARASEGPPPVLHITTYRSPSGLYELTVDPSHILGEGRGHYRLARGGQTVWADDLSFTLWQAAVSDDGVVAGYAYTTGWRGRADNGEFVVCLINPDGSPRLVKRTPREEGGLHMPPNPVARGFFLDADNDRVVYRFDADPNQLGEHEERWEVYRLRTGEALPPLSIKGFKPEVKGFALVIGAGPVPGTGLTLVAENVSRWGDVRREGLRLALLDRDGVEQWSVERPDEFNGLERFSGWDVDDRVLMPAGPAPGTFVYRSVADQARLTFTVAADPARPGGWMVTETGRAAEAVKLGRSWDEPLTLPAIELREVGEITLQNGDAQPPLRVHDPTLDGRGRFGFLSRSEQGCEAVQVDTTGPGEVKRTPVRIEVGDDQSLSGASVGGGRWAVVRATRNEKTTREAFWLDEQSGELKPIEGFSGPAPHFSRGVIGSPDGGFFILGGPFDDSLAAFGADGRARWTIRKPGTVHDAVPLAGGGLALLTMFPNAIVAVGADGAVTRTIELAETLGYEPEYITDLAADGEGWVLVDFGAESLVYLLDADGKSKSTFRCRFQDGRTFRPRGGVRRGPDGRLWTSDGTAFLRLTEVGVVDEVIGRAPGETATIGELRVTCVDQSGLIYAMDGLNGAVHVFDSRGQRLRVLRPDPSDFGNQAGMGSLAVDGDGCVYAMPSEMSFPNPARYLKFNADGGRAGFERRLTREVGEEWVFRPGGRERLVLVYDRAYLVNAGGEEKKPLQRRADRRWLEQIEGGAVAADGTFAVVGSPFSGIGSDASPAVTVFSTEGEPLRTLDLPAGFASSRVAHTGDFTVLASGESLVVLDNRDGRARAFKVPGATSKSWLWVSAGPDGREVWLRDSQSFTFRRFALPE